MFIEFIVKMSSLRRVQKRIMKYFLLKFYHYTYSCHRPSKKTNVCYLFCRTNALNMHFCYQLRRSSKIQQNIEKKVNVSQSRQDSQFELLCSDRADMLINHWVWGAFAIVYCLYIQKYRHGRQSFRCDCKVIPAKLINVTSSDTHMMSPISSNFKYKIQRKIFRKNVFFKSSENFYY